MSFRLHIFLLPFLILLSSCGPKISSPRSPLPPSSSVPTPSSSCEYLGSHSIFSISIDGADVGREVRTDIIEKSDSGNERFIMSHLVKNEKMGKVLFQSIHVRTERTSADSGHLVYASFVKKDQVSIDKVEVFNNSDSFERRIVSTSPYKSSSSDSRSEILLKGNEVIGFRLIDSIRKHVLNEHASASQVSYFDANINNPILLLLSSPTPSDYDVDGTILHGFWVEVTNSENQTLIARYFFDESGVLWVEHYPDIHETRTRLAGSFSLPTDTSELIVGLRSNSYIYDPNIASRATYHLTSTPDRLDKLDMLDDALNQKCKRISDNKIELVVHAGAPDLKSPPSKADLESSFYIRPSDPSITNALLYLRSGGKKGFLSEHRRLNATPVIARVSMIDKPRLFWSDNEKVAGLVMNYVWSILPDKRHTFSMSTAVETLSRGAGDCTEHAVLFASLMRSHGIPTRLVTGMLLTPGGLWAYHMWNSYWDGESWRAVDASTKTFHPGALYVSLGRGASVFKDVRDRLADFMWRTFSGVSFDLVDAANEGESLFLARPVGADRDLGETALFNAVVLSERGDHLGALNLLDENIPESSRSIAVKLMRIELLILSKQFENALEYISILRTETSSPENISHLNRLEFDAHIHLQNFDDALRILSSFSTDDQIPLQTKILRKAKYLFFSGQMRESIDLISDTLTSSSALPASSKQELISSYANYVSLLPESDDSLVSKGFLASKEALTSSHFVDSNALVVYARLLFKLGRPLLAYWYTDHALILSPRDDTLRKYSEQLSSTSQSCYH